MRVRLALANIIQTLSVVARISIKWKSVLRKGRGQISTFYIDVLHIYACHEIASLRQAQGRCFLLP